MQYAAAGTGYFPFYFQPHGTVGKRCTCFGRFYKKVLQLAEITNRTGHHARRWFSLGEDKELHLISDIKEPVNINKAVHLALTTNFFDAFVNKLREMKIKFSDWPGTPDVVNIRADGIKQVFLQDIDGYWIEVNSVKGN